MPHLLRALQLLHLCIIASLVITVISVLLTARHILLPQQSLAHVTTCTGGNYANSSNKLHKGPATDNCSMSEVHPLTLLLVSGVLHVLLVRQRLGIPALCLTELGVASQSGVASQKRVTLPQLAP
jgi:hypothetical protein